MFGPRRADLKIAQVDPLLVASLRKVNLQILHVD